MYEIFRRVFVPDTGQRGGSVGDGRNFGDVALDRLLALYGGVSFNDGLYRVIDHGAVARWNEQISVAFPTFSGRVSCFGMDWLGRVFALDAQRHVSGSQAVVLFEPGTGEVLEIPCNILSFHEDELINHREEALAESFYRRWRESGGSAPRVNQCIGYRRPLFLGGADTVDNLEVSDVDVYWSISAQLIRKTRGLPPGTPVGNISID